MRKSKTSCCALAHINRLDNDTTEKEIKSLLGKMNIQAHHWNDIGDLTGIGQTAVFTICTPEEDKLKKTLEKVGFKEIHQFKRRVGYPETGNLRMMVFNIL